MFKKFIILVSLITVACANEDPATEESNYIVVFKRPEVESVSTQLAAFRLHTLARESVIDILSDRLVSDHQLSSAKMKFSVALQGGVYSLTPEQVEKIAEDPLVAYVEKDQVIRVQTTQAGATWGLDRLDQVTLPLNQSYSFSNSANEVNVYVIDTGILLSHGDFGGRAQAGFDALGGNSVDCNGHGTHVAGTIGSRTYGVAKEAKLIAVRVLDCDGSGTMSGVISGVEWVTANHTKPAAANMSLGGAVSQALDDAVKASIQSGVTYAVAAGNENTSACNSSPSRVAQAITVGSSTATDARSSFSNYGNCLSLFAPGSDIKSTWSTSATATNTISGTSMASPHVAGVAALYLSTHPQALPAEVKAALLAGGISGKVTDAKAGSPNLLLNTLFLGQAQPEDSLQNGVARNGLGAAKGEAKFYSFEVPGGFSNVKISTIGGSGDADLYVKRGAKPSVSDYDCRSYTNGNLENCALSSSGAERYYILVQAYSAFSGLTLKAEYSNSGDSPECPHCENFVGQLSLRGAYKYFPDENGYHAQGGVQQLVLRGPASADFDLYLYHKTVEGWVQVSSSTDSQSFEQITFDGKEGVYRAKVISYSGSGGYNLSLEAP